MLFSTLTVLKVLISSRFGLRKVAAGKPECVILGNGPSLNETLQKSADFFQDKDVMCVNYFVRSDYYQQVKPAFYVIASPEYWVEQKKEWQQGRMDTFRMIAGKTTWPITLIVPLLAAKHQEWKKILAANEKISIRYFNNTPVEGFRALDHLLFRNQLGMPRPHNVLIPCLMMAINMSFEKVFVAGADHSWLPEIRVSDENRVMLRQKHFYDDITRQDKTEQYQPTLKPMYKGATYDTRALHEVLEKFLYAFQAYWRLNDYAETRKVKIYNITPGSYIDAFERYYDLYN